MIQLCHLGKRLHQAGHSRPRTIAAAFGACHYCTHAFLYSPFVAHCSEAYPMSVTCVPSLSRSCNSLGCQAAASGFEPATLVERSRPHAVLRLATSPAPTANQHMLEGAQFIPSMAGMVVRLTTQAITHCLCVLGGGVKWGGSASRGHHHHHHHQLALPAQASQWAT
jgi:hypothetical protein